MPRQIIDGARQVTLFGEKVPVRAQLYTINGFSAHADRDELLAWHRALKPAKTLLVHGDEQAMLRFASALENTEVLMPRRGDAFVV